MPLFDGVGHHYSQFEENVQIAEQNTVVESDQWVVIVDSIILVLTIIGALIILGLMGRNELKGRATTLRMRLVQSLIFSDLVMGIIGIIGCALTLDGKPLVIRTAECDGLGVLMVAILFSQHVWTLTLAVGTFMILIHPLHWFTSGLEKYWVWSWPFVWAISFGVAVIGYEVYGYGPSGGICFYENNAGLYSELIQFIPRAVVFIAIAILYGRLYVFLRRPDKIRTGFSDPSEGSHGSYSKHKHSWINSRGSKQKKRGRFLNRGHKTVVVDQHGNRHETTGGYSSDHYHTSSDEKSTSAPPPLVAPVPQKLWQQVAQAAQVSRGKDEAADIPPWERVELPVFQVDGQRYGGASANPEIRAASSSNNRDSPWKDWHGFHHTRKRPATSQTTSCTKVGTSVVNSPITSPLTSPTRPNFDRAITSPLTTPTDSNFSIKPNDSVSATNSPLKPVDRVRSNGSGSEESTTPTAVEDEAAALVRSRPSVDFGSSFSSAAGSDAPKPPRTAPPTLWQQNMDAPDGFNPDIRRPSLTVSEGHVGQFLRRTSQIPGPISIPRSAGSPRGSISVPAEKESVGFGEGRFTPKSSMIDVEKGMSDAEQEDDWDLMRMLAEDPPHLRDKDEFHIRKTKDKVEYVPESMASYLNRKTALLMLWFPLGYVFLFSVSLIRIIYDFVGEPPTALRAVSRWMVFGQGLLNVLIYGAVEFHTKRVVRRRVRKGTFSPRTSNNATGGSGLGSAVRGLTHGGWRALSPGAKSRDSHKRSHNHHGVSQTASQSQIQSMRQNNGSPTVSFVDPERSILQRLELNELRRGSELSEEAATAVEGRR